MPDVTVAAGFADFERSTVAELYWTAFGKKLSFCLGPDAKAHAFLTRVVNPRYALCARSADGTLLGVAGFKTSEGSLVGGSFSDLRAVYGLFGSLWRALLLSVLERDLEQGTLLMDGICVAPNARGKGLGTLLLRAIKSEAHNRDCTDIRLDVINTNPRAQALYEREGFVQTTQTTLGPLKYVFGFSSSWEMRYALQAHS